MVTLNYVHALTGLFLGNSQQLSTPNSNSQQLQTGPFQTLLLF